MTPEDRAELDRIIAAAHGEPQHPRVAREDAGLSLGQAAKVLPSDYARLRRIEAGTEVLDDLLHARMERAYRCVILRTVANP